MNSYIINALLNNAYPCVVIATSYADPIDDLAAIETELAQKAVAGPILFDMLGYSGNGSERFISLNFDGTRFDKSSYNIVNIEKGNSLRKITADFFADHTDCLEATVLSTTAKNLIRRGVAI